MNKYFTSVAIPELNLDIDFHSRLMFIGSCFADSMGSKFEDLKFSSLVNPFGVLYNPHSVANGLSYALEAKQFCKADLFEQHGLYKSFYFHSRFNDTQAERAVEKMNEAIRQTHKQLKQTDVLFITFGTAWTYQLADSKQVVANCHKHPSSTFIRKRLTVTEIVSLWNDMLSELHTFNPKLRIVFTVSPIRHWKDGAHGNQLSKSTLLLAVDELLSIHDYIRYFPSYEVVMDELRDYRFYADDMLHLSDLAVNHIWQLVQTHLIAPECHTSLQQIKKLNSAVQHRMFNALSSEALKFATSNLKLIKQLEQKYKTLDFSSEKNYFEHMITNRSEKKSDNKI
ncbi:MAG: GSCFA domain-containing protein [Mangrovibacterium sp.]